MSAEAELDRLERQVLGAKRLSAFFDLVEALRRALERNDPRLLDDIGKLTAPRVGRDLAAAVAAAFNLGAADAARIVEDREALRRLLDSVPTSFVTDARAVDRVVAEEVAKAKKLAGAGVDAREALAPVFAAANTVRRTVTTLVNSAGNAGATAVADETGTATVWVAETNACVRCLAYSGRVAAPGKRFPNGLTYGSRSYDEGPLPHPPLHPHCRCTVEPLVAPEYADALRREADRSVLRGFSLESESMATRIDAARRLLESGVDAPESVKAYARRAIKAGRFPTRGRP